MPDTKPISEMSLQELEQRRDEIREALGDSRERVLQQAQQERFNFLANESLQDFYARSGACIQVRNDRWPSGIIVFESGARLKIGDTVQRFEPPTDEYERLKIILEFWRAREAKAIADANAFQQSCIDSAVMASKYQNHRGRLSEGAVRTAKALKGAAWEAHNRVAETQAALNTTPRAQAQAAAERELSEQNAHNQSILQQILH